EELAAKLGVHQDSILKSPHANLLGLFRAWTPEERALAQSWADSFYERFILEVASSRKMTRDQVHEVAQGRIWSGADAQARRLVDGLGGWEAAVASAKQLAHIHEGERFELVTIGEPRPFFASLAGEIGVGALLPVPPPSPLGAWLHALGIPPFALAE